MNCCFVLMSGATLLRCRLPPLWKSLAKFCGNRQQESSLIAALPWFDAAILLRQDSAMMNAKLEALLNQLLEAERAGHALLEAMTTETADPEIKALFANFTDIEVGDVNVLEGLIRLHGGAPSRRSGDFAEKVLRLKSLHEQINL